MLMIGAARLAVVQAVEKGVKDIAISTQNLSYSATGTKGHTVRILDSIDLSIEKGEFVAIVGPSGCGKSTLLNLIAGLISSNSESIQVLGTPVTNINPQIGYAFQTHALLPWRCVLKNVELGLELMGMSAAERSGRAREALAQFGLQGFEDYYPSEISGGMRQRVSLARTLVTNPDVLLMDEPFGALDAQTKLLIQDLFIDYWERNRKTVIFVTHDLAEAIALADRVFVMSARPGRFKAVYDIAIERPRHLSHVRTLPEFTMYWEKIWGDLKEEAAAAMLARGPGSAG